MRVKLSDIDPELRLSGAFYRLLAPFYREKLMRVFGNSANVLMKGRWRSKTTVMNERYIPRADGTQLRVCVFTDKNKAPDNAAGLLWLHGGGYALGLPEQDQVFIERFVKDNNCVVVAPDYRLSTEAPYPAALDDCRSALRWLKDNSSQLGVRSDKLFVGGDSAGGGLTAALTLYERDNKEVSIAFQMPLYPMIDDRMSGESAKDNNAPVWNSKVNAMAWKMYLGGLADAEVSPYAAPARALELSGMPPTCSFVGTIEPFYDETVAYINALEESGVPTFFETFEGCFHAFDIMCPKSGAAKRATALLMDSFHYALHNFTAAQYGAVQTGGNT